MVIAGSVSVKAQDSKASTTGNGIVYSIGAESGLISGSLRNAYKWNLGGSLQADIPVASQLFVTVNAGYQNYFSKDFNAASKFTGTDIHLIPAKVGLKFFPVQNFYVQGEAGADFLLNKSALGFEHDAAFVYAPQVGYQFKLSGQSAIDAGVRYERSTNFISNINTSKINTFALRIAYSFSLK